MMKESAFQRRWHVRRSLYRWLLFAWFLSLAFLIGPKFFLWFWEVKPAPNQVEDFVPIVQQYCVPVVKKIKEYRRDHGHWPATMQDIDPAYTNNHRDQIDIQWGLTDRDTRISYFECYTDLQQKIEYDFTPGREKWSVSGPFVTGDVPVPPVVVDQPTLQIPNGVKP